MINYSDGYKSLAVAIVTSSIEDFKDSIEKLEVYERLQKKFEDAKINESDRTRIINALTQRINDAQKNVWQEERFLNNEANRYTEICVSKYLPKIREDAIKTVSLKTINTAEKRLLRSCHLA